MFYNATNNNNIYSYLTFAKYFFIVLCIILFFFILYVRNKFKFWTMQPVFHIYDISYYFFPPGIIEHGIPEKNKYCNFKNVETIPFSKISDLKVNKAIRFIEKNYLKNKENKFVPKKENFIPYFTGHNCECFCTTYSQDELVMDTKTGDSIETKKIISVMASRPLHIFINNGHADAFFDVYYIDYLCVDPYYRKSGIAPQIIQTHEYNQRIKNKNIKVSLFKREGDLTGIVPLCLYSTYGFPILQLLDPLDSDFSSFHPSLQIVEIGTQNMHILTDFIKRSHKKFDMVGIMETANLLELVKTKNMYIYIIVQQETTQTNDILCAYFFAKTCTFMKKGVEVLALTASIHVSKDTRIFTKGYHLILLKICQKYPDYKYATIEDISDNSILLKDILKKMDADIKSPTAYFFYNFAYPTFKPAKVFLLH